jgi:hypothetical protein
MSDWGDGLVSLSFSSRLRMHQKKKSPQDTEARSGDRDKRQHSRPRQQASSQGRQHDQRTESNTPRTRDRQSSSRTAQTQGRQHDRGTESHTPRSRDRQNNTRGGQTQGRHHDQGTESHTPRTRDRQNNTRATTQTSRQQPTSDAKPRTAPSKMTRPPTSRLSTHSQSQKPTSAHAPKDVPTSTKKISAASRAAQLTVLSNTNLDVLLQTGSTPMAGTPFSSTYTTSAEHSLREREYATGDYSRYLPHLVGVRKNASRPHALLTAHLALARQRDVALKQRRFALNIIGGLAEPRRQVSA